MLVAVLERAGMRTRRAARLGGDRRAVAAMEFAMVAPIMLLLIWAVYDTARALVAWEETYHAAQSVAQAAEKLSVTNQVYSGTNTPETALTAQQMQDAMTSIYAEMPMIPNSSNPHGSFTGQYGVVLSGIAFRPLCVANATNTCAAQTAQVLWSTYLNEGNAGTMLSPPPNLPDIFFRQCGTLTSVAHFPNNNNQLLYMINANMQAGGVTNINLIPQVVADVVYVYNPTFPLLSNFSYTFWASATFPAPLGGDDQEIKFNGTAATAPSYVLDCTYGDTSTANK
jgi:Flp pilus assembly protein TadG